MRVPRPPRAKTAAACWPGVHISIRRKDGRSQRGSLANNLRANAADMVKAVHAADNGEPGAPVKGGAHRVAPAPNPPPSACGQGARAAPVWPSRSSQRPRRALTPPPARGPRRRPVNGALNGFSRILRNAHRSRCDNSEWYRCGTSSPLSPSRPRSYGNVSAQAEKRIFIIANNADGYGVDRCLATGATCGAAVATAYCQSRDFTQAASFRKVDRDEITGAVPSATTGPGRRCDEFVAIECTR